MLNKTLKHVVFLFLLSASIFSCESSDDTLDTSGELAGNWELISYTTNGSTSTNFQGKSFTSTFSGEALNIDFIMTFTEDPNKAITENSSFDFELKSSVNGENTTDITTINDLNSEAEWSRNGNILIFSEEFASFNSNTPMLEDEITNPEYIIEKLTENTLVITTGVSEQVSESGFDLDIDVNLRLEFTRI